MYDSTRNTYSTIAIYTNDKTSYKIDNDVINCPITSQKNHPDKSSNTQYEADLILHLSRAVPTVFRSQIDPKSTGIQ